MRQHGSGKMFILTKLSVADGRMNCVRFSISDVQINFLGVLF